MKAKNWIVRNSSVALITSLAISTLALPGHARAGQADRGGNGGSSVRCDDETGKLKSIELMDFAESETPIPDQPGTRDEIIERMLGRLDLAADYNHAEQLAQSIEWIKQHTSRVPEGMSLPPSADLGYNPQNKACYRVQAADYNDEADALVKDPEVYNLLSPTRQAALMIHEAAYRIYRSFAKTSAVLEAEVMHSGMPTNLPVSSMGPRKFVRDLFDPTATLAQIEADREQIMGVSGSTFENQITFTRLARHRPEIPLQCGANCRYEDLVGTYVLAASDGNAACGSGLVVWAPQDATHFRIPSTEVVWGPDYSGVTSVASPYPFSGNVPFCTYGLDSSCWGQWAEKIDGGFKFATKISGRDWIDGFFAKTVSYGVTVTADGKLRTHALRPGQDYTCVYTRRVAR